MAWQQPSMHSQQMKQAHLLRFRGQRNLFGRVVESIVAMNNGFGRCRELQDLTRAEAHETGEIDLQIDWDDSLAINTSKIGHGGGKVCDAPSWQREVETHG